MKLRRTVLALLLMTIGLKDHLPLQSVLAADTSGKTIMISARRFSFEPAEVTLKKGEPATIILHSEDVPHGLRVREVGLDLKVGKGATAQAIITPDKTGDFVGHCSTFCGSGHGSMSITFHVVP